MLLIVICNIINIRFLHPDTVEKGCISSLRIFKSFINMLGDSEDGGQEWQEAASR